MQQLISITNENIVQRRSEQILASEVGDDLVMMDIESGQYITLNKVAHVIWSHIETPIKVSDLITKLMESFNVTEEECTHDTLEYLNKMYEQHLLFVNC